MRVSDLPRLAGGLGKALGRARGTVVATLIAVSCLLLCACPDQKPSGGEDQKSQQDLERALVDNWYGWLNGGGDNYIVVSILGDHTFDFAWTGRRPFHPHKVGGGNWSRRGEEVRFTTTRLGHRRVDPDEYPILVGTVVDESRILFQPLTRETYDSRPFWALPVDELQRGDLPLPPR